MNKFLWFGLLLCGPLLACECDKFFCDTPARDATVTSTGTVSTKFKAAARSYYCFYIEMNDECGQEWERRAACLGDLGSMIGAGIRMAASSQPEEKAIGACWLRKATALGNSTASQFWDERIRAGDITFTTEDFDVIESMSREHSSLALEVLSKLPLDVIQKSGAVTPRLRQLSWLIAACRRSPMGSEWHSQNCLQFAGLAETVGSQDWAQAVELADKLQPKK